MKRNRLGLPIGIVSLWQVYQRLHNHKDLQQVDFFPAKSSAEFQPGELLRFAKTMRFAQQNADYLVAGVEKLLHCWRKVGMQK